MSNPNGILFSDPQVKPLSTIGLPQAGAYLLFYLTGTTTPANVYADGLLATPLSQVPGTTQPSCTADSAGRFNPIYLNPATTYRVQMYTALGVKIEDTDPYLPPGIQATLNQAATNQQFANAGAKIQRLNDRVMVGDAGINDGNFPNVTQDWLSAFQTSQTGGPANGTLIGVQMAVLGNHLVAGLGAFLAGAETVNCTASQNIAISTSSFAINNSASFPTAVWAYYGEAHRMNNTVGASIAFEIDVVERGVAQQYQPYSPGAVGTIGIISAAGAGLSSSGQQIATAAMVVGANPMAFNKGLVFAAGSIQGTNGVTGTGYAIAMAKGHLISWWATGGVQTGTINGNGTTTANAVSIDLDENFLLITAKNGLPHTQFNGVASAVNSFVLSHAATTNPPIIQTIGSDTNVDLEILTQGAASYLKFGNASHFTANGAIATTMTSLGPTGSHTTVQEWLTIKDAAGTVRYIPCY